MGKVYHCSLDHAKLQGNEPTENGEVMGVKVVKGKEARKLGPWVAGETANVRRQPS